ncbi:MAG TPA: SRPBCC domain-containing protein [Saprospiraceae bacterium]|nr:SRPBCC domain-containing protein [Saprospiraceae bacterium]
MPSKNKHILSITKSYNTNTEALFNLFNNNTVFTLTGADEIESDFRTGGKFCLRFKDRGVIQGQFIEITPPKLILEWNVEGFQRPDEVGTIVEIMFKQEGEQCILNLRHRNILSAESLEAKRRAWGEIMEEIEEELIIN